MKDGKSQSEDGAWLLHQSQIRERPFTTTTPLIGPLIARFRALWNSVATKWYVRPLLNQQNRFNQLAASQLNEHDHWLILQDQEQTEMAHDLAQMAAHLKQINHRLQNLDDQIAKLEVQHPPKK